MHLTIHFIHMHLMILFLRMHLKMIVEHILLPILQRKTNRTFLRPTASKTWIPLCHLLLMMTKTLPVPTVCVQDHEAMTAISALKPSPMEGMVREEFKKECFFGRLYVWGWAIPMVMKTNCFIDLLMYCRLGGKSLRHPFFTIQCHNLNGCMSLKWGSVVVEGEYGY